ncbi:MAG: hypothetical protein R3E56_06155 [Burkholderiaceae bacterium]
MARERHLQALAIVGRHLVAHELWWDRPSIFDLLAGRTALLRWHWERLPANSSADDLLGEKSFRDFVSESSHFD